MVEQVVAALSSFRKAAAGANENVRQILRDLLPTVSRGIEQTSELSSTSRANSNSDADTKAVISKTANIADETSSIGKEILSELKRFATSFGALISESTGMGLGGLLGGLFGLIGGGPGGDGEINTVSSEEDLSVPDTDSNTNYNIEKAAHYSSEGGGEVEQAQSGKIRDKPIDQNLLNILSAAAAEAGVNVRIVSGGQMSLQDYENADGSKEVKDGKYYLNGKAVRTGSTRHDNGGAADLDLIDPNTGQTLEYNNETKDVFHNFMTLTRKYGATGIGFGFGRNDGYMGGDRIHIGFGADAFWGEVHEDENTISSQIMSISPGSAPLPETQKTSTEVETAEKSKTSFSSTPLETKTETPDIFANFASADSVLPIVESLEDALEPTTLEPSRLELVSATTYDLSKPPTYASVTKKSPIVRSGISMSKASDYQPPKPMEVEQASMIEKTYSTRPEYFDRSWIEYANEGSYKKNNKSWVA